MFSFKNENIDTILEPIDFYIKLLVIQFYYLKLLNDFY